MRKSLGRKVIQARTSFSNDAIPSDLPASPLLILFSRSLPYTQISSASIKRRFDPWLIKAQLIRRSLLRPSFPLSPSSFSDRSYRSRWRNQSHLEVLRGENRRERSTTANRVFLLNGSGGITSRRRDTWSRVSARRLDVKAPRSKGRDPAIYAVFRRRSVASVGGH